MSPQIADVLVNPKAQTVKATKSSEPRQVRDYRTYRARRAVANQVARVLMNNVTDESVLELSKAMDALELARFNYNYVLNDLAHKAMYSSR